MKSFEHWVNDMAGSIPDASEVKADESEYSLEDYLYEDLDSYTDDLFL